MAIVGLRDLHYAPLTKDDATGVTYGPVVALAGAVTAKISPKVNSETLYADDMAVETASALGQIDVEIEVSDLPLSAVADLLGYTVGSDGVLKYDAGTVPPYVALGFRSQKSNGKFRYVWLVKGRFDPPEENFETKADKPKFQTATIKGTFVARSYDRVWKYTGDEDETGFTAGATWFNAVYGTTGV